MDLLSFPPEVLPTVFGFLSVRDRKNVRLTCRLFQDACDRKDIVEREKFVFHFGNFGDYIDTSNFIQHIGDCERVRSAVEFRAVDLTRLPLRLWENLGGRVTSLLIDHCFVDNGILEGIFVHCSELVHFHVNVPDEIELFALEPNLLDQLIRRGIERVKLRTFKLFIRQSLSDNTFRKIFKIFPNIETFGQGLYRPSTAPLSHHFMYDEQTTASQLELPPSVKNFVHNIMHANSAWLVPYITQPTLKFKEIEFMQLISNDEDVKNITDFFSSQTDLHKIRVVFRIHDSFERDVNNCPMRTIILHIIQKLPMLKALTFFSDNYITLSELDFITFFTTLPGNLETLKLSSIKCRFGQLPARLKLPLTHLSLDFECGIQSEILSCCHSLQCLGLEITDVESLKRIFRDHTELKKLSVDLRKLCQSNSFGENFPARLPKLEWLDVHYFSTGMEECGIVLEEKFFRRIKNNPPADNPVIINFISGLDCPKLKVFRCLGPGLMFLTKEDIIEVLRILSKKTPWLETLILNSELPLKEYHLHCRNFEKLRYIVRVGQDDWSKTDAVKQLFDVCPSLTFVINNHGPRRRFEADAYFYDRTTGSLITRSHESCKHLCEVLNIPWYRSNDEISLYR